MSPVGKASAAQSRRPAPTIVGRYVLFEPIACGGMATVHLGRQLGLAGMGRVVAIKRMHPHLATQPEFATMFLDEARMASRVRHPNVVSLLDLVAHEGELLLVMDYIHGESLARIAGLGLRAASTLPFRVASAIVVDVLAGLDAAHRATSEAGQPLGLVHRDVSPQNIMVGADGIARVIDFGIATAIGRLSVTRDPSMKGKIEYMAPEQLRAQPLTRQTDLYASAVVLWECLTGRRLIAAGDHAGIEQVLLGDFDPPSRWRPDLPRGVDDVVMRGLASNPARRYVTAHEMALALEAALPRASVFEVSAWVRAQSGAALAKQALAVSAVETMPLADMGLQSAPPETAAFESVLTAPGSRRPRRLWAAASVGLGLLVGASALVIRVEGAMAGGVPVRVEPPAAPASPMPDEFYRAPLAAAQAVAPPLRANGASASRSPRRVPAEAVPTGTEPAATAEPPPSAIPTPPLPQIAPGCLVPYEIDAQGHRHYIRACLKIQ